MQKHYLTVRKLCWENKIFQNLLSNEHWVLSRKYLGPVVQSIISLTSSLRGQLVKYFRPLLLNTLKFFVEKWEKLLHCKSFSLFQQKILAKSRY